MGVISDGRYLGPLQYNGFFPPISVGQGRIDGAVCQYDLEDKMEFLKKAEEKGIVNIEMECIVLGALCHACNVRCACVCVTLLDRLEGDQVCSA